MSIPMNEFCGQQQPHAAHVWQKAYGELNYIGTYQCAGLIESFVAVTCAVCGQSRPNPGTWEHECTPAVTR